MATLNDLKKYLNYEFSTGCYTGEDYKSFQRKYINYLKSIAKENGWEILCDSDIEFDAGEEGNYNAEHSCFYIKEVD